MRIESGFVLRTIKEKEYLLPYGNRIASFQHGIELMGCGSWIAEQLLEADVSKEELLEKLQMEYVDVPKAVLQEDMNAFLSMLQGAGVLEGYDTDRSAIVEGPLHTFCIANIRLGFYATEELIHPFLQKFTTEDVAVDVEIRVAKYAYSGFPEGRILARSSDVLIYDTGACYGLLYSENEYVRELRVTKDGKRATLYFMDVCEDAKEEAFLAIRSAFLVYAQHQGLFALHSVSVADDEGVVLFSGHSGAGKSTHAKLWEAHLGATILNGDLNLLGMEENRVMVYGIPWCGTSEICTSFAKPLWGVYFIHQNSSNQVEEIQGAKRVLTLSNRMISPTWTKDTLEMNLDFAEAAEQHIFLGKLYCNMEVDAAQVASDYLHQYIQEKES